MMDDGLWMDGWMDGQAGRQAVIGKQAKIVAVDVIGIGCTNATRFAVYRPSRLLFFRTGTIAKAIKPADLSLPLSLSLSLTSTQ
ncbi:hypothetical protein IF2G_07954 [Cordyceps javanica]|nr:hypothetical protein IF2G_07954 [Cordyceps javanica]